MNCVRAFQERILGFVHFKKECQGSYISRKNVRVRAFQERMSGYMMIDGWLNRIFYTQITYAGELKQQWVHFTPVLSTYLIFLADKDNQELENCSMLVFLSFLHSANFGSGRCNLLDEYLRVSEIITK